MTILRWVLGLALAAFFIYMGQFKFYPGANPVFTKIAAESGISLFEPIVRMLTGVAEIVCGLLLILPRTRLLGALLGFCILLGAIGFHFSPWLGIDVPELGKMLFYMALGGMALNIIVLILEKNARATSVDKSYSDNE